MTTPKVNTIKRGSSRFYVDPESGRKNPGVTSVLNMLPKEFLKFWAAKLVAEEAVADPGLLVNMVLRDPAAAVDHLKNAPNRFTRRSADVGTDAHDLFERIAKGEDIGRVHPDLKPYVEHFREFLTVFEPEFIFLEETVWSDTHGYAGSFDVLMVLHGEAAGPLRHKTVFGDWKTTRSGVHEEVALQLSGYRFADYIVRSDGSRVPLPKTDGAVVLLVRPEGWKLVPVETGEVTISDALMDPEDSERVIIPAQTVQVHDYLKALREVFDWDSEVKKRVIGKPLYSGGEWADAKPARINKPRGAK